MPIKPPDLDESGKPVRPPDLDASGNPVAPTPSLLDKIGGWRGLAGGAIRAGSGILAAEGGLPGAGISALGEGLAELAEGSDFSPTKVGVEAGFGLIPFHNIVTGGKVLRSALRSGALGAAHTAVSQASGGDIPSPKDVAVSGGLGALLGAGGSALSRAKTPVTPKYAGQAPKVTTEAGTKVYQVPAEAVPNQYRPNLSPGFQSGYRETVRSKLGQLLSKAPGATEGLEDLDKNIAQTAGEAAKTRSANQRAATASTRAEDVADRQSLRDQIAAEAKAAKESANQAAEDKINQLIEDKGLVPGKTAVTKSVTATTEEGDKLAARTAFKKPKKVDPTTGDWDAEDLVSEPARHPDAPPAGTPAGNVYDDWIAHGRDHKTALNLAIKGLAPKIPLETPVPAEAAPPVAAQPVVPEQAPQPVVAAAKPKRQGASKVQKFNRGVEDILSGVGEKPVTEPPPAVEAPQPVVPATPEAPAAEPQSALAQLFKSPVDAAGANYRAAKAAEGENPLAQRQAGIALQSEAKKAGLPTRGPSNLADFLQNRVTPDIAGETPQSAEIFHIRSIDDVPAGSRMQPAGPVTPESVAAAKAAGVAQRAAEGFPEPVEESWKGVQPEDWVQRELDAIERLKKGESGAINPALLSRIGAGGLGALIGAPTGVALGDPEDPYAAVKGALAGGMLGFAGAGGAQRALERGRNPLGGAAGELTNYRNAGLLATPAAQLKKPLSDIGAVVGEGAEKLFTPGKRAQGMNVLKELFRLPTNVSNYKKAMFNPDLAGEVIGDAMRSSAPPERDLLGLVGRPFGAAQYSTQQMLERAGVPLDEARKILFLGDPETKLGKYWLAAQDPRVTGEAGSRFVRAVRPFTRIATNLAERGIQRIPGVSMMTGDPETRIGRTVLGTAALGAGALTGATDATSQEAGEEPTSPIIRGLRRAALASYGLPFILGEALAGPRGARDLYYAIPGIQPPVNPPGPGDTLYSAGGKIAKEWLTQMLPDWANPYNADKPIR